MIRFFWIAEYNDGTNLSQFNFDGTENLFSQIQNDKLCRFGWYPFSIELSKKVENSECCTACTLSNYKIKIYPNDELYAMRRGHFSYGRTNSIRYEYLLGNQNYVIIIQENGDCEVKNRNDIN